MDPSTLKQALLQAAGQLDAACGPTLPTAPLSDPVQVRELADQIADNPLSLQEGTASQWHQGISPKWLGQLAAAYRDTGEPRYALAAARLYEAVLAAEPWEAGWQPPQRRNPLILAHRLGNTECVGWFGALPALLPAAPFDDAFVARLLASASEQLCYLALHMHAGRNIRLTQADTLITQGLRLHMLPQAAGWLERGVLAFNDGWRRLVAPDGASREATPWYHTVVMNMALRLWRIEQAMPHVGLALDRHTIARMFDYTLACVEPDGRAMRIGDAIGRITPEGTLASFIERRAACLKMLGADPALPDPVQCFPHVGQAMIRSDWSTRADSLVFDATARNGHHWHPARNSLQLCIDGQRVLSDPGRMSYDDTPHRRYALSTRAHTTVNFNGWQQSDAPATLRHGACATARCVEGVYAGGYWPMEHFSHGRGLFGRHRRLVLWSADRFWLVLDQLAHTAGPDEKPDIESLWHFAPGVVEVDAGGSLVQTRHDRAAMDMHLLLKPPGATVSRHEGEMDPVLGWSADDQTDQPCPSPTVLLRAPACDPWYLELLTLLVPGRDGHPPDPVTVERVRAAEPESPGFLELAWPQGARDRVWWTFELASALESADGITTDASLLHVSTAADSHHHAVAMDATFVDNLRGPRETAMLFSGAMR